MGGSVVKNLPANAGDVGSIPKVEGSLEKEMTTHSVFVPGISHGQKSLVGYRHDLATEQQQACKLVQFS